MNILRLSTLSLTLAIVVFALGSANPSFADKPGSGKCVKTQHEHCHDDDESGRDETFYDVVIGPMTSNGMTIIGKSDLEHPWLTFGNGTSIGLGDATLSPPGPGRPGIGEFTDLSFFTSSSGPFDEEDGDEVTNGQKCFPKEGDLEQEAHEGDDHKGHEHRGEGSFSIHQGRVQEGRGGRVEASFWFHGFTHTEVEVEGGGDELVKVLYALQLTGEYATSDPLLPTLPPVDIDVVLAMTTWRLSVSNEGKAIKNISCIGKDDFVGDVNVTIRVTGPV